MRIVRKKITMGFEISYTSKEITPWGGMFFFEANVAKNGL